jgi:hypothetical protein
LVSPVYSDDTNKPGHGQLCIFDSAEEIKNSPEKQSSQGRMTIVMQCFDEIPQQINTFAKAHKQIYQIN